MSIIYAFAGAMHFIKPKMYMPIIPDFLPQKSILNLLAGLAEIILAIGLLFSQTRAISAIGIILMLLIFLIVHFNMLRNKKTSRGIPQWILILRIPLQFFLIWWAYIYI
ncbi:MAG: DoxX family protein [Psychroflexus halocasei]